MQCMNTDILLLVHKQCVQSLYIPFYWLWWLCFQFTLFNILFELTPIFLNSSWGFCFSLLIASLINWILFEKLSLSTCLACFFIFLFLISIYFLSTIYTSGCPQKVLFLLSTGKQKKIETRRSVLKTSITVRILATWSWTMAVINCYKKRFFSAWSLNIVVFCSI